MPIIELSDIHTPAHNTLSLRGLSWRLQPGELHIFHASSRAERHLLWGLLTRPCRDLIRHGEYNIWGLPFDHNGSEFVRMYTFARHDGGATPHAPVLLVNGDELRSLSDRTRTATHLNQHVHEGNGLAKSAIVVMDPRMHLLGLQPTHTHRLHHGRLCRC